MEDDRLSSLPDEILHLILSDLPIKSQIETSHLSRRWRHLWSLNPVFLLLDWIDPYGYCTNQDRCFFRQLLQQWRPPHILAIKANFLKFPLRSYFLDDFLDDVDLYLVDDNDLIHLYIDLAKEWIDFAATSSLQHLSLDYHWDNPEAPPFSQYMKSGLTCLKFLELKRVPLTDGPFLAEYMKFGLPSLNVLLLSTIKLTSNDLDSLLSSCPLLETLKLSSCKGLEHAVVSSPSLKYLDVDNNVGLKSLVIAAAPMLINLVSTSCLKIIIENKVPKLLAVSLIWGGYCKTDNPIPLLRSISHIRLLSIDVYLLKALVEDDKIRESHICIFGELKELHLNGPWLTDLQLKVLHIFLAQRPSIEKLCLQLGDGCRCPYDPWSEDGGEYIKSPLAYHEYVGRVYESHRRDPCYQKLETCTSMSQSRIVRVIGFMGTRNEMRFVRFILESASNLESLDLFCGFSLPSNLIEQLSWCRRASMNARVIMGDNEERLDMKCQQPDIVSLCEFRHVIQNQSGRICSQSLHPYHDYTSMKFIYVYQNESFPEYWHTGIRERKAEPKRERQKRVPREKGKGKPLSVQDDGWTEVGGVGGPSGRRNSSMRQGLRPSAVNTHNLFEVLSTMAAEEDVSGEEGL